MDALAGQTHRQTHVLVWHARVCVKGKIFRCTDAETGAFTALTEWGAGPRE